MSRTRRARLLATLGLAQVVAWALAFAAVLSCYVRMTVDAWALIAAALLGLAWALAAKSDRVWEAAS
ncbi:hypothetical protein [Microbacterium gubbeenense]|uniref:hypothetical protein n=1 Tax=Microbacterium gubbeenense TaxID=159896 RepID=UPI0003FCAC0C|nr:hypothetical protein [Microbacterium gubbeenense]